MTASGTTQSIVFEYDLPHAPAKVWRALTESDLLARWLMSNDMKPTVGNSFTFRADPTPWWDGIVQCEIREVDPPRRLTYTWGSGPESSPLDTVVTWTLTPTPSGGTRLGLEHSGFQPDNKYAFEGARAGWDRMVGTGLRAVLAEMA